MEVFEDKFVGFDVFTMISVIGGNLGLWLGISILQLWSYLPISAIMGSCTRAKNIDSTATITVKE